MFIAKSIYNSEDDFFNEVFKPAFSEAVSINVVSGYFSAQVFELFKEELKNDHLSKFRLIIGADTSKESIEFIQKLLDCTKEEIIERIYDNFFSSMSNISNDTILMLHQLLDENKLEIQVGLNNNGYIFHAKEYLIETKNMDMISITGSVNFTSAAMLNNYETIEASQNIERYKSYQMNFNKLWSNCLDTVTVKSIKDYFIGKIETELSKRNIVLPSKENNIKLRDYQLDAINGLLENDFNGLLNMATGTGKTFTSIAAIDAFIRENSSKYHLINIVVPYLHLATQWKDEIIKSMGANTTILVCHSEISDWKKKFIYYVEMLEFENIFVIMVNNTFKLNFDELKEYYVSNNSVLIFDEAHNLTNKEYLKLINENIFNHKIALTATPNHYIDTKRTENLYEYFGKYEYKYDLAKAIENGHLTRYDYNVHIVSLDVEEEKEYKRLTKLIKKSKGGIQKNNLLEQRSLILSTSKQKLQKLQELIIDKETINHTLIYCSAGSVGIDDKYDYSHLEQTSKLITDVKNGVVSQKITYAESTKERVKIVDSFIKGHTQIILAIRCLDEGYNIPAIKDAYILSSTQNPKEFVQRRGRILRKFKGKVKSSITDFIVEIDGEIVEEDIARFKEYVYLAENKEESIRKINNYIWS